MANIASYSFSSIDLPQVQEEQPGTVQGVFFTMAPEHLEDLLDKILGWFEGRDYVFLVDHGVTDKRGLGYIILEWEGFSIDPLFLAILRDEEMIEDYSTYRRSEEEEEA